VDDPPAVRGDDIRRVQAHRYQEIEAGDGGGARPRGHQANVRELLVDVAQAIVDRGGGGNRGAVLVVVEDGDVGLRAKAGFDAEAVRGLDVLEIHAAEARFQALNGIDQLVGIILVDLDIKDVDPSELLEQHPLAFHDGLGGEWSDIPQAKDG